MIQPIIIDNDNIVDELTEINLSKDIVFTSPANIDILKWNTDGRISIVPDMNINVSMLKLDKYQDIRTTNRNIKLKMSFPVGLFPQFLAANSYTTVVPNIKQLDGYIIKDPLHSELRRVNILSTTPSYYMYDEIVFKLIFDLRFIREELPTQVVTSEVPLIDILLTKTYSSENTSEHNKLYYIKDDLIYNDFINQVSGDDDV